MLTNRQHRFPASAAARALGLALAAALLLGAGEAAAQTPLCPTAGHETTAVFPPGTNLQNLTRDQLKTIYRSFPNLVIPSARIECRYGVADNKHHSFLVRSPKITVADDWVTGIYALHESRGTLEVYIHAVGPTGEAQHFHPIDYGNMAVRTGGVAADYTTGEESHAIHVEHTGEGGVGLDFRNLSLFTQGDYAYGVYVKQQGSYVFRHGTSRRARGEIVVRIIETDRDREGRARPLIATRGDWADAVRAEFSRNAAQGDITVAIKGYTIATGGIVPQQEHPETYPPPTGQAARAVFALHQGYGDIRVSATDAQILTWGNQASAIFGHHEGKTRTIMNVGGGSEVVPGGGVISLTVSGGEIRTMGFISSEEGAEETLQGIGVNFRATGGSNSHGVYGWHQGDGPIDINLTNASVSTTGAGVFGHHKGGDGAIDINLANASVSTTEENAYAYGVLAWREHGGEGDVSVSVAGGSISTATESSYAVWGRQEGAKGGVSITAANAALSTAGKAAHGVIGVIQGKAAVDDGEGGTTLTRSGEGVFAGEGDIAVSVAGGSISTAGELAHGVHADHHGDEGEIAVTIADGASIATAGENAYGVYARHIHKGAVAVALAGSVGTAGDYAYGARLYHSGVSGDMSFRMTGGEIRTTGAGAHGVSVEHHGDAGAVAVTIAGGEVSAAGENAYGVWMKTAGGATLTIGRGARVSATQSGLSAFADGRGDFAAMIHGTMEGGVVSYASGENTVTVGPSGAIKGIIDGVAIHAEGGGLHVDLSLTDSSLNARGVADVLGGDIVTAAPEETTVIVNGVTVFDGVNGVVDVDVPNGPFDVRMSSVQSGRLTLTERYAPRASVYEALPGLLLRLSGARARGERKTSPGSPVWASVWRGEGSRGDGGSTVGASHDFEHSGAEAGLYLAFPRSGGLSGSVSVRQSKARADVSMPSGKGDIELEGAGAGLGLSWRNRSGWYLSGNYSFMEYDADLASEPRGKLKSGADATVRAVGLEAGRRLALSERFALIPRVWAARASTSIKGFTDSVGARFSLIEGDRLTGGAGVAAETEVARRGWTLSLRGALDVENALSGEKTTVDVSGHRLHAESEDTRILMGLDALYREGPLSLGLALRADGLGTDDEAYGGRLSLGLRF